MRAVAVLVVLMVVLSECAMSFYVKDGHSRVLQGLGTAALIALIILSFGR